MKKVLFLGSSNTFGVGLHTFKEKYLTEEGIKEIKWPYNQSEEDNKFIYSVRWTGLVADHLNRIEINVAEAGGSPAESLYRLQNTNLTDTDYIFFEFSGIYNYFDRYLYYLNNIDTEYILYFLDDMYPLNIIDITILTRLIDIMNKNDNIKLIKLSLDSYPFNNGNKVIYDNIHFIKANNNLDEYILNLQPFIIKKNFFIDLVNYCKKNNTFTHQNGGLEVFGTNFFKNTNYIALRVINEVVKIPYSGGIVTSGIISDPIKKMLKEKEDIDIKTYDNNLIYELTNVELNNLGDRLKEHYNDLNIKCIDS
jgi:hypothetical protein